MLCYPILAYQPRVHDLDAATTPSWLLEQNARSVDLSWFENLHVFDSAGFKYVVRRARIGTEHRRLFGLQRQVDLVLDFDREGQPVSLGELTELVSRVVETDDSFWSDGSTGSGKDVLLSRIRAASSYEALIRLVAVPWGTPK